MEIDGSQHHGSISLSLLFEELTRCSLLNYFAQPDKLICPLIWLHDTPTVKIVHRRGVDRAQNYRRGCSPRPRHSAFCRCISPAASRGRVPIMAAAHAAGLYTNLITSAVGIAADTLRRLSEAGLDHVQISIQDSERASADRIAGYEGAFARKFALAAEVVHLKIPLTVKSHIPWFYSYLRCWRRPMS